MQLEELPDCYRNDEVFEVQEMDEIAEGRGQRKRNVVSYNDGLSDDAWALVRIFFSCSDILLQETCVPRKLIPEIESMSSWD